MRVAGIGHKCQLRAAKTPVVESKQSASRRGFGGCSNADGCAPVHVSRSALRPASARANADNRRMTTVRVRSRLATSHPIPAYGGIQLGEEILADVARAMSDGTIPMHFGHDITRPVRTSGVVAGTERLDDGFLAVWAEFDVDSSEWDIVQDEFKAAGVPGGMSISISAPMAGDHLYPNASATVAADAHHFGDEAIREAAAALSDAGLDSGGERLYQFSGIPEAKVVFDLVLPMIEALGISLTASVIYDAAKHFLLRRRTAGRTIFNVIFRETPRGTRKLQIHIETDSENELHSALERLPAALEAGLTGTFRATRSGDLVPANSLEPTGTQSRSSVPELGANVAESADADPNAQSSPTEPESP